jgi:hypothetical protein
VASAQDVPKVDLFFGYSGFRANQAQNLSSFNMQGGLFNAGYNFTNHLAAEFEFGGYHNGDVHGDRLDATNYSWLLGPRLSLAGRTRRVDPYIHTLFGINRAETSISSTSVLIPQPLTGTLPAPDSDGRYREHQANFAMAAGGGLDIKLNRHVAIRPVQIDYYLTRFEAPSILNPGGVTSNRNQHNIRAAAGLMFNIGGEKAPPPPIPAPTAEAPRMHSCPDGTSIPEADACPKLSMGAGINVTPSSVCQGAAAQVSMSGNVPRGATYAWTVNGESVSHDPTFQFGANGRNAGTYTIGVTISAEGYNDANAQSRVTVLGYEAPRGTLTASRPEIYVGETALLTPSFTGGQCGGQIGPATLTASEGTINGREFNSQNVRFDPPGPTEQRKTVTITARATDNRGAATAETTVVVKQRAAAGAQRFSDILFTQNNNRVNNCGKRVLLEDLQNKFNSDPGGKVVLVGHTGSGERNPSDLALKRALNGAAVISAASGICARFPASSVLVKSVGSDDDGVDYQPNFCAASNERPGQNVAQSDDAKYRRLEVWFVPSGGTVPASASDAKDASTLGVASLGCPR